MSSFPSARLRPATSADREFLDRLFCEAHRDEFAPLNLPQAQLDSLLGMQARAQRESYARDFAGAADQIVLDPEGGAIGRLLVDQSAERLELVDIALVPEARGAGTGKALLRDVMARGQQLGLPVRLQVRPGNRAFHLYTQLGFQLRAAGMQLELEWLPLGVMLPLAAKAAATTEWDALVGSDFAVETVPPGQAAPLRLTRIEHSPAGRSFSLFFTGALAGQISQGTWSLRSDGEEEGRWIFLVPVGPVGSVMEYEAVFTS